MAFLMALLLSWLQFDQGWWSLAWALLAADLGSPFIQFAQTRRY